MSNEIEIKALAGPLARTYPSRLAPAELAKWLEDLRSGRFQQGSGWLVSHNAEEEAEYCCMGVLCESKNVPRHEIAGELLDGITDVLSGWEDLIGNVTFHIDTPSTWTNLQRCCAGMNDGLKWNFNQIAHWLETHVETVK